MFFGSENEKAPPALACAGGVVYLLLFLLVNGLAVHAHRPLAVDGTVVVQLVHALLALELLFLLLGLLGGGFFVRLFFLAVLGLLGILVPGNVLVLFGMARPVDTVDRQRDEQDRTHGDNTIK